MGHNTTNIEVVTDRECHSHVEQVRSLQIRVRHDTRWTKTDSVK